MFIIFCLYVQFCFYNFISYTFQCFLFFEKDAENNKILETEIQRTYEKKRALSLTLEVKKKNNLLLSIYNHSIYISICIGKFYKYITLNGFKMLDPYFKKYLKGGPGHK